MNVTGYDDGIVLGKEVDHALAELREAGGFISIEEEFNEELRRKARWDGHPTDSSLSWQSQPGWQVAQFEFDGCVRSGTGHHTPLVSSSSAVC